MMLSSSCQLWRRLDRPGYAGDHDGLRRCYTTPRDTTLLPSEGAVRLAQCAVLAGTGRARRNVIALSYFNAGVRIYDISDPRQPREVAYFSHRARWRDGRF